jgi:hypothetical protein
MFVKSQFPVTVSILTGFPQLPQIVLIGHYYTRCNRLEGGGGQQKGVAGYCEEETNRNVWQDIASRRPTEMCGRILRGEGQQKVVAGYSFLISHVPILKIINLNYAVKLTWSQKNR